MQKSILLFSIALLSMISALSEATLTVDKTLWQGSIKFPSDVNITEPIRVYYTGEAIPHEIDNIGHQICFTISEYKMRTVFHLIIVDSLDLVSEQNTVQYFKVPKNRPYKLYELVYTPNKDFAAIADADVDQKGTWQVEQKRLADDLRIPDSAIIIRYHPHLVKGLEGGNAIELPRVVLDEEILKKLTPEELHDASIQFVLSAIDFDSFHTKPNTQIKTDFAKKTVLALTT